MLPARIDIVKICSSYLKIYVLLTHLHVCLMSMKLLMLLLLLLCVCLLSEEPTYVIQLLIKILEMDQSPVHPARCN